MSISHVRARPQDMLSRVAQRRSSGDTGPISSCRYPKMNSYSMLDDLSARHYPEVKSQQSIEYKFHRLVPLCRHYV